MGEILEGGCACGRVRYRLQQPRCSFTAATAAIASPERQRLRAERARADVHIFTSSKQPWVDLPADVPAFDIYYDMRTLRPAESLVRRDAILGTGLAAARSALTAPPPPLTPPALGRGT